MYISIIYFFQWSQTKPNCFHYKEELTTAKENVTAISDRLKCTGEEGVSAVLLCLKVDCTLVHWSSASFTGNTPVYLKQASDLTKNVSTYIKMCSFYFKITSKLLFSMKTGKVWRKNLVQKIWQIWGLTTSKITYSLYPKVLMDGNLKRGCSTGETNMNGGSDCISNQARLYTD